MELAGATHSASGAVSSAGKHLFTGTFCANHATDNERDDDGKHYTYDDCTYHENNFSYFALTLSRQTGSSLIHSLILLAVAFIF